MSPKCLTVFFIVIFLYEYCLAEVTLAPDKKQSTLSQDNLPTEKAMIKANINEEKPILKVLENSLEVLATSTESGKNVLQDITKAQSTTATTTTTISQISLATTPTKNMETIDQTNNTLNTTEKTESNATTTTTSSTTASTTTTTKIIISTEAPQVNINSTDAPILPTTTNTTTLSNNSTTTRKNAMPADGNKFLNNILTDCSHRERLKKQPKTNANAKWRKCCPHGESLNINQSDQLCVPSEGNEFKPDVLEVTLYDNCIEDMETHIQLPVEIGNQCNKSFVYNSEEDRLVVLQDGSLLVMDINANESYTIEQKYCLDYDYENNSDGHIYAIICITSVDEHLNRSQVVIVAVFMLISIPLLILLTYLHMRIRQLRSLHGLSLGCMSFCLAMGYLLYALAYIFNYTTSKIGGYTTQFFILSYFVWFFCICFNSCLNIWYKFPKQRGLTKSFRICNFILYFIISIAVPTTLVIMSIQKGLPGMPSYFVQGFTESIRESQRYFIPPISTIVILCFLLIVTSFFGFQRIKKLGNENNKSRTNIYSGLDAKFDMEIYGEIKKDAKCISLLWLVMAITWLLEIVTFYAPGPENYLMFMEILNGLQGAFVLLIFFVVRDRRAMILHWWYDRGTHNLESVEMRSLNKKPNENNQ